MQTNDSTIAAQIKEYETIIGNIQLLLENPSLEPLRRRKAVWHLIQCQEMIEGLRIADKQEARTQG